MSKSCKHIWTLREAYTTAQFQEYTDYCMRCGAIRTTHALYSKKTNAYEIDAVTTLETRILNPKHMVPLR